MRIVKPDAYEYIIDGTADDPCYDKSDTIEITDWTWRPYLWAEYVKCFNNRPEGMTAQELWEFGATSMLNALISLGKT
jgi:hypothetical protein